MTLVRVSGEQIVMAPGYKDGVVFASTVPSAGGNIGTLWALDARTGRRLWSWEQVPRSLWGQPQLNGGGGLWHPPAFDGEGGLYVSIANPVPWPGTEEQPWGRSRPGPNRWNNSIVKLDARTGRFLWGTQVGPHDLYDWDLEAPVILATVDGRRVALSAGKMGFVYAFDAESGRLLWKRSVGIHNGHDDDSVRAMHGRLLEGRLRETHLPRRLGRRRDADGVRRRDGLRAGQQPLRDIQQADAAETAGTGEGTGELVAIDIATGRVRWDTRLPHGEYGGATVTNDLVLTTTYDGTVWALDRHDGSVLWRGALPAASIAPVAVTGDTLLAAGGIALDRSQRMRIVAYRLGGAAGDAAGAR